MRIIKRKLFWAWQFEKEEAWLNENSKEGQHLVAVSPLQIKYEFDQDPSKEYTYRIEFLDDLPSSRKGRDYLEFLEELEVEQIGSYLRWVYLRKDKDKGEFELHSDLDSKIKHFKRVRVLFLVLLPMIIINMINMINLFNRTKNLFSFLAAGLTIIVAMLFITGFSSMSSKIKELDLNKNIWE
jgi:hypothetical protein